MGKSLIVRACALAMAVGLLSAPAALGANRVQPFAGHGAGPSTLGEPIASCPAGSGWWVEATGTGMFTVLGPVTYSLGQCAAGDLNTGWGWTLGQPTMTLVATDGDQLVLAYQMTFKATLVEGVPTTAKAFLTWKVSGGTGSFAHARGAGNAWMSIQYGFPPFTADMSSVWFGWLRV